MRWGDALEGVDDFDYNTPIYLSEADANRR